MDIGIHGVFFGGKIFKWKIDNQRPLFSIFIFENSNIGSRKERQPLGPMLKEKRNLNAQTERFFVNVVSLLLE